MSRFIVELESNCFIERQQYGLGWVTLKQNAEKFKTESSATRAIRKIRISSGREFKNAKVLAL